jgi:KUP system potassium uptake protein
LNYAGQSAIVLDGAPAGQNIFFQLCPDGMLVPLVILATLATIIASQAIITGAFSMTRQAIQLGWMPRLDVRQTSKEGYGQIYIGGVNWVLMIVTIGLTLGFKKSDNLASAYGIAVSLTMLMTTLLLFVAMREIWRWSLIAAAALAGLFLIADTAFFLANLSKVAQGGYVPLLLAALVYGVMWIWHIGSEAVSRRLHESLMPVAEFTAQTIARQTPRVPGAAIFLTRTNRDVPPGMAWHLEHIRALHTQLLVLTVNTAAVPWIEAGHRFKVEELAPNFWRAEAVYGFMDHPDVPALLATAKDHDCAIDLRDVTYFVGHASIGHRTEGEALPRWIEAIYAAMVRNSSHPAQALRLPADQTLEIGRQIEI